MLIQKIHQPPQGGFLGETVQIETGRLRLWAAATATAPLSAAVEGRLRRRLPLIFIGRRWWWWWWW
jgi:hypothetical protein